MQGLRARKELDAEHRDHPGRGRRQQRRPPVRPHRPRPIRRPIPLRHAAIVSEPDTTREQRYCCVTTCPFARSIATTLSFPTRCPVPTITSAGTSPVVSSSIFGIQRVFRSTSTRW
jgi:hypothetical protein